VGLYAVFETPQPLKQALSTSGIYTISAQDLSSDEKTDALPLTDPGIQQAFQKALPPTFIQNSAEQAIDSTYNWVHGVTNSPDFAINISSVKTNFADNVAAYMRQKLEALPPCTQIMAPPTTINELLDLTCRPQGISTATIAAQVRQEVLNSKLFADNDTVDTASFKDAEGKPFSSQLSFIPTLHQYYLISLYVLPIVTLLFVVAIVYWSLTKRAGIKRIAWLLIGIGITNVVLAVVEVWFLHAGASIFGTPLAASSAIQDKALLVLETLATELRNWWLGFGAAYVLLGIIALIILGLNKPKPALVMGSTSAASRFPTVTSSRPGEKL
jgi:hypothetical protein